MQTAEVSAMIVRPFTYTSEAHTVAGRRCGIRIENLSPVLSDEERAEQRRCIEAGLFEVFARYADRQEEQR